MATIRTRELNEDLPQPSRRRQCSDRFPCWLAATRSALLAGLVAKPAESPCRYRLPTLAAGAPLLYAVCSARRAFALSTTLGFSQDAACVRSAFIAAGTPVILCPICSSVAAYYSLASRCFRHEAASAQNSGYCVGPARLCQARVALFAITEATQCAKQGGRLPASVENGVAPNTRY